MEFDWDAANIEHIARHEVTPVEFVEAFYNAPVFLKVGNVNGEDRFVFAGRTNEGRVLRLVWTMRDGRIRPVTAHESTKHRKLFQKEEP